VSGEEGRECLESGLDQAGNALGIERRAVGSAERDNPYNRSPARKKRIQGVELAPVSHFVNSMAPLRTNGSRAANCCEHDDSC